MLGGEYRHNLDPKNRIFIPAKLREELGATFVITKDVREKCLRVYSQKTWEEYLVPIKQQARRTQSNVIRYLSSTMTEVTPDSHGRVVLPKELISFAKIEKNVVVVGCSDYAEIWAEDEYDNMVNNLDLDQMIAELEALGL